ncbi:MAG: MopE-related protein [Myxococcota bacterium]|nr:MopE-related protein [Myxococcota bacterium]
MRLILTLVALSACNFIGDKDQQSRLDPDNDGVLWPDDCNDNNPNIGAPQVWYIDEDGDGFGSDDNVVRDSCTVPLNGSATGGDCDDTDNAIYPTAQEIWYNGVDNDCLGGDDFDQDGDGEASSSYNGLDCDDTNPSINTSAVEIYYDGVDQDCDNNENECDQDGDGFDGTPNGEPNSICPNVTDCDDTDASIYPNDAIEIPLTGIDEDCNFQTGDGDVDGDGYWATDYETQMAAIGITIEVPIPDGPRDCWDDSNAIPIDFIALNDFPQLDSNMVYPNADDLPYDGIDSDCSGGSDFDNDGDGFETTGYENREGNTGTDCDDDNNTIFPGAFDEFYDGVDANCDGLSDFDQDGDFVDSAEYGGTDCNDFDSSINNFEFDIPADGIDQDCNGMETCYIDTDIDGYGSSSTGQSSVYDCSESGFSSNSQDCDDNDAYAHPGAASQDSTVQCMRDFDGDGYGDMGVVAPLIPGSDCNDNDGSTHPGALEITDSGVDENCDGSENCYRDDDEDGFRTINTNLVIPSSDLDCTGPQEAQVTDPATDCNDALDTINPDATELIDDGIDSDCDGSELCYTDEDSDGFRHPDTSLTVNSSDLDCKDPGEGAENEPPTDCDDLQPTAFPGGSEIVGDGVDQDCDGSEICFVDEDDDHFRTEDTTNVSISADLDCTDPGEGAESDPPTDCDDNNPNIRPFADEFFDDGVDNNCDGFEANGIECEGTVAFDGVEERYMLFCDASSTWDVNQNACLDGGYDGIASLYSSQEQADIEDIAFNLGPNGDFDIFSNYWIGLSDGTVEDSFWWISDESETVVWSGDSSGNSPNGLYTNWEQGEPDNNPFYNCVYVSSATYAWVLDECTNSHQKTCEARRLPTP